MKLKMFLSVAIIVGAAVLVTGATLALFTSEAVVGNNTLAAGKLELTIETPEVRNFTIDNIYPGQELDMSEVEITNSGTLPYYLKAVISETEAIAGPGGGYLPEAVTVTAALSGYNGKSDYSAKLAELIDIDLAWENGQQLLVVEPGEAVVFKLEGQFDLASGNEYQESAWEGAITFTAVQADSQPSLPESVSWSSEPGAPAGHADNNLEDLVLLNAATDRLSFSASRTDHGSAANLAEIEPENEYALWQANVGGAGLEEWIKYDFGTGKTVWEYSLKASKTAGHRSPGSWHLQGSDDALNWSTLDTRTGISFLNYEEKRFKVSAANVGSYRYYRILITESNQNDRLALGLVKLFIAE